MSELTLAAVSVIEQGDSLVLVRRVHSDGNITVETPGGHIELGETPEEAVVREVKEEAGLTVKITSSLGVIKNHDSVAHYFKCEMLDLNELENNPDVIITKISELLKHNITKFAQENLVKLGYIKN